MDNVGKLLKLDIAFELKKFKCRKEISARQYYGILEVINSIDDISSLVAIKFNLKNILETSLELDDVRVFHNVYEFADFLCFDQLCDFIQVYYLLNSIKLDYISKDFSKYSMARSMLNTISDLIYDISCDNIHYDITPYHEIVKSLRKYNVDTVYLRHFKALNLVFE